MVKADYLVHLIDDNVVYIIDLDDGGMSVTNDIDNVIAEICNDEAIVVDDYNWVYRDTSGQWDEYDPVSCEFNILGAVTPEEAYTKLNLKVNGS
jgi:hypothetical protein